MNPDTTQTDSKISLALDRRRKLSVHTNWLIINFILLWMKCLKLRKIYIYMTLATQAQILENLQVCIKGYLHLTHFKVDIPLV